LRLRQREEGLREEVKEKKVRVLEAELPDVRCTRQVKLSAFDDSFSSSDDESWESVGNDSGEKVRFYGGLKWRKSRCDLNDA